MGTVLMSGAGGFLGRALAPVLEARGDRVLRLVRRPSRSPREVRWDPAAGGIDLAAAPPLDAVVHLAGATVAGRWSTAQRRRIRDSRVLGTRLLAGALAELEPRPRVLVAVSAIGYYGDRGDERLAESSAPGRGFLAGVVKEWEEAADPARVAGIRVVHPRLALVLSKSGGVLRAMLPSFRCGLGAVLGDGRQWWSWVALADTISILVRFLEDPSAEGAFNVAAPGAVTQREFAGCLSQALHRPAALRIPRLLLRVMLDGFATESLLASTRVVPERLLGLAVGFRWPQLGSFLEQELG